MNSALITERFKYFGFDGSSQVKYKKINPCKALIKREPEKYEVLCVYWLQMTFKNKK